MKNFHFLLLILITFLFLMSSCSKDAEEVLSEITEEAQPNGNKVGYCQCGPLTGDLYFYATSSTSVLVSWEPKKCGTYQISIRDQETGSINYASVNNQFHEFKNLNPCRTYLVSVRHETSKCVYKTPLTSNYSTCYCPSTGLDLTKILIDGFRFHYTPDNPSLLSQATSNGYSDLTSTILLAPKGVSTSFSSMSVCVGGSWNASVYVRLWIDQNNNKIFEANELDLDDVLTNLNSNNSNSPPTTCVSVGLDGITFPDVLGQRVARLAISIATPPSACGDIFMGQVIDFTVEMEE